MFSDTPTCEGPLHFPPHPYGSVEGRWGCRARTDSAAWTLDPDYNSYPAGTAVHKKQIPWVSLFNGVWWGHIALHQLTWILYAA